MGIMSSTPNVPGAAHTQREEGNSSLVPPNADTAAKGSRRAGAVFRAGIKEDWASIATSDPAFWLKD